MAISNGKKKNNVYENKSDRRRPITSFDKEKLDFFFFVRGAGRHSTAAKRFVW